MADGETLVRYDGVADWYDESSSDAYGAALAALLGPGDGLCLDIGCGTGHYFDSIRSTGRDVVGLDLSADQLRIARTRGDRLVRGSAWQLPFSSGVFPAVTAIWVSTDIDQFALTLNEIARVLRPQGRLVILGVHPCFNGPCVQSGPDGSMIVHPTYRRAERHLDAPWWGSDGIRRRVGGMRHLPLAEFLQAIAASGLHIDEVTEPGDAPIPSVLAIVARRIAS